MAGTTNGGGNGAGANNGGGKVISMPLQYSACVLAAAVVFVMVLSLSFMSSAAMVAVRQDLGSVASAAGAPGSSNSTASARAAGLATASPPVARKEKERTPVVLFNFGDSNSDTGGVAAANGIGIMPPEGRYLGRSTGQLSDRDFFALVAWELWKERNTRLFRNKATTHTQLLAKIKQVADLWIEAGARHLKELGRE